MELLCCKWCALLVICWLSALALELLFELLFMELLFALELLFELLLMELLFIIRPGAAVYNSPWCSCSWSCWCSVAGAPDHSAAVYHSPSSCCLWSCCLSFALELLVLLRL